jgi:hypothetical protein
LLLLPLAAVNLNSQSEGWWTLQPLGIFRLLLKGPPSCVRNIKTLCEILQRKKIIFY